MLLQKIIGQLLKKESVSRGIFHMLGGVSIARKLLETNIFVYNFNSLSRDHISVDSDETISRGKSSSLGNQAAVNVTRVLETPKEYRTLGGAIRIHDVSRGILEH